MEAAISEAKRAQEQDLLAPAATHAGSWCAVTGAYHTVAEVHG